MRAIYEYSYRQPGEGRTYDRNVEADFSGLRNGCDFGGRFRYFVPLNLWNKWRLDARDLLPDFVEPEMSAPRFVPGEQEVEEPDAGLRLDPAPRALAQFAVVVMAAVQVTSLERLRQCVEILYPLARPRPVRRQKRAVEQVHESRRHGVQRQRSRRLPHLPRLGVSPVGEAALHDRALQRHLFRVQIPARKRVPPHKEKLEDHHRQPEAIVLLPAIHFAERYALQFRRSVFRKPALAAVGLAVGRDLEAVDVQQVDRGLPRHQDVFGVQVADDQPVFVDGGHRPRDVRGDVNQERPRRLWEFLQPALGAVQRVNLLGLADLLHHEADDLSVRSVAQRRDRPGGEIEQPFIAEARQGDELLGLLRRRRLVIDLGHQVAIILNFVDFAFRAGSNSAPQSNDLRLGRVEDSVNRLDNFYLGVAGNFGHGCTLIKPVWGASLSTSTILLPAPDYYS